MSNIPDNITVTLDVGLDMPVSDRYVQTGEESWHGTPVTLLDVIIERTAHILAAKAGGDSEGRDWRVEVRSRARSVVDERVGAAVDEVIANLLSDEIQLTNWYGERTGQVTTLRALVVEKASKQLVRTPNGRSSFDKTPFDKALDEAVGKAITGELAQAIADAKAELTSKIRETASSVLADAIVKGVTK